MWVKIRLSTISKSTFAIRLGVTTYFISTRTTEIVWVPQNCIICPPIEEMYFIKYAGAQWVKVSVIFVISLIISIWLKTIYQQLSNSFI
jgi:hypothetical protein